MQKNTVLTRQLSKDRIPGVPTINQLSNSTGISSRLLKAFLSHGFKSDITYSFNSLRGSDHASTGIYRLRKHLQAYLAEGRYSDLLQIPWLASSLNDKPASYLRQMLASLKIKKSDSAITLTIRGHLNEDGINIVGRDFDHVIIDDLEITTPTNEPPETADTEIERLFRQEEIASQLMQIKKEYDKQQALSAVLSPKYDFLVGKIEDFLTVYGSLQSLKDLVDTFESKVKHIIYSVTPIGDIQND